MKFFLSAAALCCASVAAAENHHHEKAHEHAFKDELYGIEFGNGQNVEGKVRRFLLGALFRFLLMLARF